VPVGGAMGPRTGEAIALVGSRTAISNLPVPCWRISSNAEKQSRHPCATCSGRNGRYRLQMVPCARRGMGRAESGHRGTLDSAYLFPPLSPEGAAQAESRPEDPSLPSSNRVCSLPGHGLPTCFMRSHAPSCRVASSEPNSVRPAVPRWGWVSNQVRRCRWQMP
jgi:hypothetical protein